MKSVVEYINRTVIINGYTVRTGQRMTPAHGGAPNIVYVVSAIHDDGTINYFLEGGAKEIHKFRTPDDLDLYKPVDNEINNQKI